MDKATRYLVLAMEDMQKGRVPAFSRVPPPLSTIDEGTNESWGKEGMAKPNLELSQLSTTGSPQWLASQPGLSLNFDKTTLETCRLERFSEDVGGVNNESLG